MVLVGPVTECHALEQLIGDVWIARCSNQGGIPVKARKQPVLDGARLDVARPAHYARHPEATLKDSALSRFERCHAAIRPSEHFGSVVGGEDDDGVVRLADVIQVLQERTDTIVHLGHTGLFLTVVGLVVHEGLVFRGQECPDMHARRIVPNEKRLALALSMKSLEDLTSTSSKVVMSYLAFGVTSCIFGTLDMSG